MELIYIRVIKHYLLENQEFNFSNKYRINYEDDSKCYNVERLKYIDSFYGINIINITAIVGDNGCGKSTLLRILLNTLPYGSSKCTDESIVFAILENNTIHYYSTMNELNKIKVKAENVEMDENIFCIYDNVGNFEGEIFKKSKIIYTNNFLDYSDYFYKKYGEIEDLSFGGLMARDYRKSTEMRYIPLTENNDYDIEHGYYENFPKSTSVGLERNYVIGNYYNCEILRQLIFKYIYDSQYFPSNLPFEIPSKINLKLNNFNVSEFYIKIKREIVDFKDNNRDGNKLLGNIDVLINNLKCTGTMKSKQDFILIIAKSVLVNAINEVCLPKGGHYNKEQYYDILQTLSAIASSADELDSIESLFQCLKNWDKNLKNRKFSERVLLTPYIYFMSWLIQPHDALEVTIVGEYNVIINLDTEVKQEVFMNFFELHIKTNSTYRYIDFYWSLSSGEFNLFSLYARFFSILQKGQNTNQYFIYNNFATEKIQIDSLIILIDEADLTFHPKWQQRYIKSLVDFLAQIYKSYKVQIILTTHSPIILSDIDHSSVIRISKNTNESRGSALEVKNSEEKTFAQNIHTLFVNSFFLDIKNSGETLGDFSYSKINYCLELLNNALEGKSVILDNGLKFIEYLVDKIGEPVVYEMLSRKLMDYKKYIHKKPISQKVDNALTTYKDLSVDEKREFIKSIIGETEGMQVD